MGSMHGGISGEGLRMLRMVRSKHAGLDRGIASADRRVQC